MTRFAALVLAVVTFVVTTACGAPIGGAGESFETDRAWADDKIALLKGKPTVGALYTAPDEQVGDLITSNESDHLHGRARQYIAVHSYLLGDKPPGKQAAGHVEPKAAAYMRDHGITYAALVINFDDPDGQGFCGYASGIGCKQASELVLPQGSTLVLWWPSGGPKSAKGAAAP